MKNRSKDGDGSPSAPRGSAAAVFMRLLTQYAFRYWGRLVVGIIAGLIMGGAMHAYLQFMNMGLSSLDDSISKPEQTQKENRREITERLKNYKFISAALEKLGLSFEETPDQESPDQESPDQENQAMETTGQETPDLEHQGEEQPGEEVDSVGDKPHEHHGHKDMIRSFMEKLGLKFNGEQTLSYRLVVVLISCMLLFFAIKSFGEFTNKYCLRWIGAKIVTDLREDIFNNLQRQSMSFFSKHDVGQIISRSTYDAGTIEHAFSNCIAELVISPMQLIVAVIFLIQLACKMNLTKPAWALVIAMPVFIMPVYAISKIIRKYQHKVLSRVSTLVARMQENLGGIRVVKSFNMEEFESRRFSRDSSRYFREVSKAIMADIFMTPVMQITAIGIGAVFILLCMDYKISLSTLGMLGYVASTAYKPIKELSKMNSNMQKCAAAAERIFETIDVMEVVPEPSSPVQVDRMKDRISFHGVTFAYDNGQAPVIRDFSLDIRKGQMVAVVGQTGSGKSTIANLLARFYDPQEGGISIDGVDLRNISTRNLRQLIGIVSQDNFLFNESVAFNIGYGKPGASREEIINAAKLANAHDFIMEDPLGYDRPCGERGCLLSGGQKQRIAIARAILKNPPILILDEATSALDTVTEQMVQQAIGRLMESRTVLAIAHRLSTIVNADNIILIDNGRIAEQGTHQQLYALNGKYTKLYDMQLPKEKQ